MGSERIHPLFFGPQDQRLFGCHHAPAEGPAANLGLVIAPALGHEYSRSHRALRQLAASCASSGMRALRFDFSSTGDSQGDRWPDSLERWSEDLGHAARELSLRTRVARTALLGVRLAGNLALERAAKSASCSALVLWDPCLDAEAYVRSLAQMQTKFDATLESPGARASVATDDLECLGFRWPRALLHSLRAWRPPTFEQARPARALILESQRTERAAELALSLERAGASVRHEVSAGSQPWNEDVDKGLVPAADLRRIVDFLREEG